MDEKELADIDQQREQYLAEKRKQVAFLKYDDFTMQCQRYFGQVPLAGAVAYRLKDGGEGILINWDHYAWGLGRDFKDCVDYEVEHEVWELWLTRGKEKVDSFGPDHYEAIKAAMRKAHGDGMLDRYLQLKRKQMKTFNALGDAYAMEELDFFIKYADKLRGIPESKMGIPELEKLTGYKIKTAHYSDWKKMADALDEVDRAQGIDPKNKWSDASNIGWPATSEWIRPDGKARYTTYANPCFAGFVANKAGEVLIYHLLPEMSEEAVDWLEGDKVVGGIMGACGLSFKSPKIDVYLKILGLVPFRPESDPNVPEDRLDDCYFNILVNPQNKEILCSYNY